MQKVGGQKKHKIKITLPTLAISLWLFICIPLLSYLNLKKSLNLGLYGDDWLQFYIIWTKFDVTKTLSFFSLSSYIGPYWPQHFFLGLIRHFYGYEPTAYFVSSLFLRILATISLYPFVKVLSKSKLAGILSTIIFAFSVTGLQTTDWVFNMNTYAGIFFLNFSFYFYIKLRQLKTLISWHTIFFIMTFTLALGVVPVRMHVAMPVLVAIDLFLSFFKEKTKINKALILRITICILIFVGLNNAGSFSSSGYIPGRIATATNLVQKMIQDGRYDFWANFFGVVGHIALPNTLDVQSLLTFAKTLSPKNVVYGLTTILGGVSIALGIFMSFLLQNKKGIKSFIFFNIFWTLTNWWLSYINPALSAGPIFSIFIGGEIVFMALWIYLFGKIQYPHLISSIIAGCLFLGGFTFIHWIFTLHYILDSTSRYLTMGGVGFSIVFGSFIALLLKGIFSLKQERLLKSKVMKIGLLMIPIAMLTFWLDFNFRASQLYLGTMEKNRNKTLTQTAWETLMQSVPTLDEKYPSVFYFTTDNTTSLYGIFTYGFWPRAGTLYKIEKSAYTPVAVVDYETLLKYALDGSPLKKIHGRNFTDPVPLLNIYAFDFRKGKLTETTDQIRQKIISDLEDLDKKEPANQ